MADNDEALDLRRRARRRLIGAVALVLFLVIVPPWIMDLEPKPVTTNLSVEIPSQVPAKPRAVPAPSGSDASKSAPQPNPREAAKSAEPAPQASAPAEPEKAPQEAAPSAPKADQVARAAPSDAAPQSADAKRAEAILNAESFVVPVGTYANLDNVKQLQAKLAQAGVRSYTEAVKTSSGEQTRVRAGPFATRDAAEKAREKLKAAGVNAGPVVVR